MRNNILVVFALFILSLGLTGAHAQTTVPAVGGSFYGLGGTVSYTVGQIVYQTISDTNFSVAQGVQQQYEISIVSVEENNNISLQCTVYPIPTGDLLMLKVQIDRLVGLSYQLYTIDGKLIASKIVVDRETRIDMNSLVTACYFLKVLNNNTEIAVFKIVKN